MHSCARSPACSGASRPAPTSCAPCRRRSRGRCCLESRSPRSRDLITTFIAPSEQLDAIAEQLAAQRSQLEAMSAELDRVEAALDRLAAATAQVRTMQEPFARLAATLLPNPDREEVEEIEADEGEDDDA